MNIIDVIAKPAEIEKKPETSGGVAEPVKPDSGQGTELAPASATSPNVSRLEFIPVNTDALPPLKPIHEPTPAQEAFATKEPPISEAGDIAGNPPVETVPPVSSEIPLGEDLPKRGRGRPPGTKNAPKPPDILGAAADPEKALQGIAGMTFDLSAGTLANIFGQEWNPRSKEEREFVVTAIANYYRETGMIEIPPKTALTLVVLAYSLPRISEPNTKQKLFLIWTWGKNKIANLFPRRKK